MQQLPQRKQTRLKEFDYSSTAFYFITICTNEHKCVLSNIITQADGTVLNVLTPYGRVADSYLVKIPGMDQYVIMPNHIHMIIHKTNGNPIASDVRSFKVLVTKAIGKSIWQRSFYDHIIRDETDYMIKWKYIDENPAKWADDEYHS